MVGQSWENPNDWYNTNVLGTINFLNQIKSLKNIVKYVHVSTPEVYGSTQKNLKKVDCTLQAHLMLYQGLRVTCICIVCLRIISFQ